MDAEVLLDENISYSYLKTHTVDIILLSSGLDLEYENEIKKDALSLDKDIKTIDYYGGGIGLPKNEVYSLFPDPKS